MVSWKHPKAEAVEGFYCIELVKTAIKRARNCIRAHHQDHLLQV